MTVMTELLCEHFPGRKSPPLLKVPLMIQASPHVLKLFTPTSPAQAGWHSRKCSLTALYAEEYRPLIVGEVSLRSLVEDETALKHWRKGTGDPDIRELERRHLEKFVAYLQGRGLAGPTINKIWRELKAMLRHAKDELRIIDTIPSLGFRRKSKLVRTGPKRQRETVTFDEMCLLWEACEAATYPVHPQCVKLWRAFLVLLYTYGPRSGDVVRLSAKENLMLNDRLISFEAMKVSKLQGLPLIDVVLDHLDPIRKRSDRLFSSFKTVGHQREDGTWKRGWRTTWRKEILPAAGLKGVTFKHLRESMVTRYNAADPGLGKWMAGHAQQGVTDTNYDFPTERIRRAIESAPVPPCFLSTWKSDDQVRSQ